MAIRTQMLAFFLLSFYNVPFAQSAFPKIEEIVLESYSTEVQVTDVIQAASAYAFEAYTNDQGMVQLFFGGDTTSVFYNNETGQITEVREKNCTVWDIWDDEFAYTPLYRGWLNAKPFRIGPSAPLWYAQTQYDQIQSNGTRTARNIECEYFTLEVSNKYDELTIEYYFAPKDWTTPYSHEKLRIPIRIRIVGMSSRYTLNNQYMATVDLITDFAYFKPAVDDLDLQPPVGLGCKMKAVAEDFPEIPNAFQFSAEVVDLLSMDQETGKDNVEVQFQRTWYDYDGKLARLDTYSRAKGFKSGLYDFNTGTEYKIQRDGSCSMTILKDEEFEVYDYGFTSRMMEPKEVLSLEGKFYSMGKREIRGLSCDTYESVEYNYEYKFKDYYKLVVTVYFTDSLTYVGVNGNSETRIPIYLQITGYSNPKTIILKKVYNIFQFDNYIFPEMYSSFRLDRCYTKEDSKASFVLIVNADADSAAVLEKNSEEFERNLIAELAVHAKVPKMRIPYLRVDYKSVGVYITGVMVERPPAELQFFKFNEGETITHDPDLKIAVEAKTIEQCSFACVDSDELCKGFYFCNQACFLKSTDITDNEDGEPKSLGNCIEYLRAEIDSTNFRQSYLLDALGFLETAVLNKSMIVPVKIDKGTADILVSELIIGEGPYTGVDMGDKPYTVAIEDRKLDRNLRSVKTVEYTGTLRDCYKRCKEAGDECSSFSFCPDASDDKKQCMITQDLVMKDVVKDSELVADRDCNIYNLKFLDLFTAFPEKVTVHAAEKVLHGVRAAEECARSCRLEKNFTCRGFEYCRSYMECSLHTKHMLDLEEDGETHEVFGQDCIHYAARYIRDYVDMGYVLVQDESSVRMGVTLDECAKICSVEQAENCKSFNYCPDDSGQSQSKCALSKQLLSDDNVTTTDSNKCNHYEKRAIVHDWDQGKKWNDTKVEKIISKTVTSEEGYTKKGFTGLVIGMLVFGLIVGALAFVGYSLYKSRSSSEGGMAVRFMKSDS